MTHVEGDARQPVGTPPSRRTGCLSAAQEARAKAYLAAHPLRRLSIAEVAALCDLSRSHFSKAFKVSTGLAPHQWVVRYRVHQVVKLLKGDRPIGEIAGECGFADQSHLSRVFARQMGMPPGQWRRQHR